MRNSSLDISTLADKMKTLPQNFGTIHLVTPLYAIRTETSNAPLQKPRSLQVTEEFPCELKYVSPVSVSSPRPVMLRGCFSWADKNLSFLLIALFSLLFTRLPYPYCQYQSLQLDLGFHCASLHFCALHQDQSLC